MNILFILIVGLFILILEKCSGIDIDDIPFSNCTNGSYCDEPAINNDIVISNSTGIDKNIFNDTTDTTNETTEYTTTEQSVTTTSINKNYSDICTCDVTMSLCDTNCCCDADCNDEISLTGLNFSHHGHLQRKIYDTRYCYTKNFIPRNNTKFILERLASNLFCIAYDNLPPIYGIKDTLDIRDRVSFEEAKLAIYPKKYSWKWNNLVISPLEFNYSSQYRVTDVLWKFQNNIVTSIELPQSGFTGECKLKKILKYGEASKWMCMQTNLVNDNTYLFPEAYTNFTVISSPVRFNSSYILTDNHICPKNVCIPVMSMYCLNVEDCRNDSQRSKFEHSCKNGYCRNVVKHVHYTIALNGTCGRINSIDVRLELINTSKNFYQSFEITFQRNRVKTINNIYSRDIGYIIGDPIVMGTIVRINNNTKNFITEYIKTNESDLYLTIASRQKDGHCDSENRHIVGFGEDTRVGCYVNLTTDKFSSNSCKELQQNLLKFLLNDSLRNITAIDKYDIYLSKMGDITKLETSNWTQILLDRLPENVITGQINDNSIRCSGIVTSFNIDILYTVLPATSISGHTDNYKISAVSLTMSEPIDVYWPKCHDKDCNFLLKIYLITLVNFNDISTPSMYHYAGGPNLDITLPYDFFYPFMSCADKSSNILTLSIVGIIINFKLL